MRPMRKMTDILGEHIKEMSLFYGGEDHQKPSDFETRKLDKHTPSWAIYPMALQFLAMCQCRLTRLNIEVTLSRHLFLTMH